MSGSGQDPSTFQRVSRDQTTRNARVTTNLQVPVYSNVSCNSATLPPVSHEGQLIYDLTTNRFFGSVKVGGNLVWKPLAYATSC